MRDAAEFSAAYGTAVSRRLAGLHVHLSTASARAGPLPLQETAGAAGRIMRSGQVGSDEKPEVIFETDGRHSNVYAYEPPMSVRTYVQPIDEVLGLGVDTISYVLGDCSVLLYDTKVGERWGHNYDLIGGPASEVWYRAGQNCAAMIASGHDPLQLVCGHTHRRGMKFLAHLMLGLLHTPPSRVTNGRVADFTTENPQWRIGEAEAGAGAGAGRGAGAFGDPNQLSYAHPEVRANRLAVIHEVLHDYDTDGIELNFSGPAPILSRGQVATHTPALTEWLSQIRRTAAAAAAPGQPKRVVVRVPADLRLCRHIGLDLLAWAAAGSIDTVVATAVECPDYSASVAGLREMVAALTPHGVQAVAVGETVIQSAAPPFWLLFGVSMAREGERLGKMTGSPMTLGARDRGAGLGGRRADRQGPPGRHEQRLRRGGERPSVLAVVPAAALAIYPGRLRPDSLRGLPGRGAVAGQDVPARAGLASRRGYFRCESVERERRLGGGGRDAARAAAAACRQERRRHRRGPEAEDEAV